MRVKVVLFLLLGLGLAALLAGRFGSALLPPAKPVAKQPLQTRPASLQIPEAPLEQAKTNPPASPSDGFYLSNGNQRVYVKYATPDPLLRSFMQSVMDDNSDPNAKGKEIFLKICAVCHQRDGEGKDGLAPPLVESEWVLAPKGHRLVRIVLNGLAGTIRVHEKDWNLSMPPWRANLNDDQVAVVLTYIRSQWGGEHAGPITPELVASLRREARATPETSDELLRIPDQ